MSKKFILNADDFGMSKAYNRAVLEGYNNGFLSSASLCANGKAFNAAVNEILPECPDLGLGVHLNIVEGKPLTKVDLLVNKKGKFNKGFVSLLLNSGNEKLLYQIEQEFRAQIEQVLKYRMTSNSVSRNNLLEQFLYSKYITKCYSKKKIADINLAKKYVEKNSTENKNIRYSKANALFNSALFSLENHNYLEVLIKCIKILFVSHYYLEKIYRLVKIQINAK